MAWIIRLVGGFCQAENGSVFVDGRVDGAVWTGSIIKSLLFYAIDKGYITTSTYNNGSIVLKSLTARCNVFEV